MKNNDFLEWIGCCLGTVLTVTQTQQIFQIISLVLTCLATAITIAYTLWKWWKKAKKDGKIDEKEIKEGIDILKNAAKDVEELSKIDKGE